MKVPSAVPPGVVTDTVTCPAAPGGVVKVQPVALHVEGTLWSSMETAAPDRFVPLMVIQDPGEIPG